MAEHITEVEKRLDAVRDKIYEKTKNMSWAEYKKYLDQRTKQFAKNLGLKLKPAKMPGRYVIE